MHCIYSGYRHERTVDRTIELNGNLFEFDESKSQRTFRNRGFTFEQAAEIFDDPYYESLGEPYEQNGEERHNFIGETENQHILVVVVTFREDENHREITRVISARRATPSEIREFEEGSK